MSKAKLTLVSFSFVRGGAGIAAWNFFGLAKGFPEIEVFKISQDEAGIFQFGKRVISWLLGKLQRDGNPTKHSLNLFSYGKLIRAFRKDSDHLFHLHWINNDTLSIWDLEKIPAYSLITLHDEWFYCGTEHYFKVGTKPEDFISGYSPKILKFGLPWNFWVWKTKKKKLQGRRDLIFTVPSKWMLERAKSSAILKNSTIHYLPNCIDTDLFSPLMPDDRWEGRQEFGIGKEDFVIGFGAIDGSKNPLKGGKILFESLFTWLFKKDSFTKGKIVLFCFGGNIGKEFSSLNVTLISAGFIQDRTKLAKVYSLSDVVLVPSLVESFGQVAAEASACGTPVVCFETSGLVDIVKANSTGWIARPFSKESFVEKLEEAYQTSSLERDTMGKNARNHIKENFSIPVIKNRYKGILEDILELRNHEKAS